MGKKAPKKFSIAAFRRLTAAVRMACIEEIEALIAHHEHEIEELKAKIETMKAKPVNRRARYRGKPRRKAKN